MFVLHNVIIDQLKGWKKSGSLKFLWKPHNLYRFFVHMTKVIISHKIWWKKISERSISHKILWNSHISRRSIFHISKWRAPREGEEWPLLHPSSYGAGAYLEIRVVLQTLMIPPEPRTQNTAQYIIQTKCWNLSNSWRGKQLLERQNNWVTTYITTSHQIQLGNYLYNNKITPNTMEFLFF